MNIVGTINRTPVLLEVLHDGNVLNTSSTGGNGSATNVTYASTDRGYQTQHGVYGATSTTTFTAVNSTRGCHFRIYPTANNKTVLQLTTTTGLVTISSGDIVTITGATNTVVYVNNVQTTTVTLNSWNDVYISWDSYNCSNPAIGNNSFTGNIGAVRFFNAVLSTQEIQSLYMEGLRKLGGAGLAPLTDGLVAYYDFNGDANDIIGGNNGTVSGATLTTDRFNNSNMAYSFNGTTNNIKMASFTRPTNITIIGWIKKSNKTGVQIIVGGDDVSTGSAQRSFQFRTEATTGKLGGVIFNAGSYNAISSTSDVCTGSWFHVALTYNGVDTRLFVNGVQEAIDTVITGNIRAGTGIAFGQTSDELASQLYNGDMGEIKILNRGIGASAVLALYNLSKNRYLTPLLY